MYSNSSLGATGRSLDIEDIEAVSSYDKTTNTKYGTEYTPTNKYYPTIFQYEEYGSIDESYTGTLGQSEQTQYYTQESATQATTLKGKYQYYYYTMSTSYMDSTYLELFRYQAGTTDNLSTYWLASRSFSCGSDLAYFGMYFVISGNVGGLELYLSDHTELSSFVALRPVVEINLASVTIGASGEGTSDSPYSITAK